VFSHNRNINIKVIRSQILLVSYTLVHIVVMYNVQPIGWWCLNPSVNSFVLSSSLQSPSISLQPHHWAKAYGVAARENQIPAIFVGRWRKDERDGATVHQVCFPMLILSPPLGDQRSFGAVLA
jgi:hypothetical protein